MRLIKRARVFEKYIKFYKIIQDAIKIQVNIKDKDRKHIEGTGPKLYLNTRRTCITLVG